MIRTLTKILIVTIVIITILFLWKEPTISINLNHAKFNSYFASVGALITAFSLYLIYIQTVVMGEAHGNSLTPDYTYLALLVTSRR